MFSVTEISEMCISITIFHNDSIFHNLYVLHYLFRTKEKERSKSTGTVGNKKKDNTPNVNAYCLHQEEAQRHNQTHL